MFQVDLLPVFLILHCLLKVLSEDLKLCVYAQPAADSADSQKCGCWRRWVAFQLWCRSAQAPGSRTVSWWRRVRGTAAVWSCAGLRQPKVCPVSQGHFWAADCLCCSRLVALLQVIKVFAKSITGEKLGRGKGKKLCSFWKLRIYVP